MNLKKSFTQKEKKSLKFELPKIGSFEFRQNFAKNLLNVTPICE